MRCPRCGNENSDSNRFCGMCGGTLLPTPAPVAAAADRVAATGSSAPSSTGRTAPAQAPIGPSPVISGPSFLGLNDPGPGKRGSLSGGPHGSHSSGNLDYLLEDEEEPSRGGGAKFVLILLALALAVGFGYLRWKNHGLPWLSSGSSKPPAAVQSPDGGDTNSTPPPTSNTTSSTSPGTVSAPPPSVTGAPATPAPAQPAPDSAGSAASPASSTPATNPAAGSAPANVPPATTGATPSPDAANSAAESTASPAAKDPSAKDKDDKDKDKDNDAEAADPNSPSGASPKPSELDKPAPKPHAAVPRAPATDNVSEAQKYIYGRGVAQDCERGMRLLKPAANQSNPKAMIEMGALYSAGLCTPHDLPTAYRWFALALRKDPDNQAVQTDLQKLWGEMTQPERQLAIKLSQ